VSGDLADARMLLIFSLLATVSVAGVERAGVLKSEPG